MLLTNHPILSLVMGVGVSGAADTITVLSGGAIEPGLRAAAAAFEKKSGHTIDITFNTAPHIRNRIGAGEVFDVVIAPLKVIKDFCGDGTVQTDGRDVGKVGSGVAVRPGAPVPRIGSAEDLKTSVLEAESIVFNRASTGIYFENLLKQMGVWDQVEPKTTRYATGAEVMKHAMMGAGKEVAFGPITEILLEEEQGLVFVGPLPPEVQNYTVYRAAVTSAGQNKSTSQSLVEYLGGPEGKACFTAAGIE